LVAPRHARFLPPRLALCWTTASNATATVWTSKSEPQSFPMASSASGASLAPGTAQTTKKPAWGSSTPNDFLRRVSATRPGSRYRQDSEMVTRLVKEAGKKSRGKLNNPGGHRFLSQGWNCVRSLTPNPYLKVEIALAQPKNEPSYSDRWWNDDPRQISVVLTETANYAHQVPNH